MKNPRPTLNREILSLALPSILANITVPLVGMADIAVAGHLPGGSGAAFIGGISIGSMLFDVLYWNFSFLRAGTGGLTAQAYGRWLASTVTSGPSPVMPGPDPVMPGPDRASLAPELHAILRRALRLAVIIGLILIAFQWVAVWLAFQVVQCSPQVRELAQQYFFIRIWAAPATLSLFAFKGWFIGLQDSVRPMIADLLVNGLNILLSVGLGFGFCGLPRMGFAGVATGTVIAQWTGFAYAFVAAWRRYGWRPRGPMTMEGNFWKLNIDLMMRAVGMVAVYIGFTVLSAKFGDVLLAVSSILMNLLLFFSYFTDGFAYAGEALTGRFIGAGDSSGVSATVKGVFMWGMGVTALFMLIYGFGGEQLLRLMTTDADVVCAGTQYLPWLLLMPLIGVPAFLWDGILTGATASKELRDSVLLSVVGFFGTWYAGMAVLGGRYGLGVGMGLLGEAVDAGGALASAGGAQAAVGVQAVHLLLAAYFVHLAIRSVYLTLRSRKVLA